MVTGRSTARRVITRLTVLGVGAALAVPAGALPRAATVDRPAGILTTDNVTYHGTIPLDAPGVGGKVVVRPDLGGKRYFYVTGAYGLSIYDTTTPTLPVLAGHLVLPHSQNEDLKVSVDGKRAVIANDGSLPFSPNSVTNGVHVIDTTDVAAPKLVGSTSARLRGTGVDAGPAEHTVACADAKCEWVYGSTTGNIYDATDPSAIKVVGTWNKDRTGKTVTSKHALNRDASGLLISDSTPRLVLDTTGVLVPGATPAKPVVLSQGAPSTSDPRLQHNNLRPGADRWTARPAGEAVDTVTVTPSSRSLSVTNSRPVLRPGELVLGSSESNVNPTCANAGGLSTWSAVNFDKGAPLQQLEVFRPLSGTWADGSPAANAAGCSAHWFDERGGYVAAAWYEHGTRFFKVDATTGALREVGYFQPVAGIASAAYWITDSVVYTVDGPRGIDILSLDRGAPEPTDEELTANWLSSLRLTSDAADLERRMCSRAAG